MKTRPLTLLFCICSYTRSYSLLEQLQPSPRVANRYDIVQAPGNATHTDCFASFHDLQVVSRRPQVLFRTLENTIDITYPNPIPVKSHLNQIPPTALLTDQPRHLRFSHRNLPRFNLLHLDSAVRFKSLFSLTFV